MAEGFVLQPEWNEALAVYAKINNSPQDVAVGVAYIRAASGDKAQAGKALAELTRYSPQLCVASCVCKLLRRNGRTREDVRMVGAGLQRTCNWVNQS